MTRMTLVAAFLSVLMIVALPRQTTAAETWTEMASPNFSVLSNAGEGRTQELVWQLEQIRSAIRAFWPWVQTELGKPMLVIIARDENSMRQLAPEFWEQRGGVRPVAIWATGADQYYMAIRADIREEDDLMVNPYTSAYFIYLHLVLEGSFSQELPLWFSRGLAGVMSNTIVRRKEVLVGLPLPDRLQYLRDARRLKLANLIATTRSAPTFRGQEAQVLFDAQSGAFVHMLLYGQQGAHRSRLERFASLVKAGQPSEDAFREALGRAEDYEHAFAAYLTSPVYGYTRGTIDAAVQRERFNRRVLAPADAAAARAGFHIARGREAEARALLDQARKTAPDLPALHAAEGVLYDRASQQLQATTAYARAVELGTTSAYAHFRRAVLEWNGPVDGDTMRGIERSLTRAVELNPRFAAAYSALGEARAALKEPQDATIGLLRRAVSLEPTNAWHRIAAARMLLRFGRLDEAAKEVEAAVRLADSDEARRRAEEVASTLEKARAPKP